VVGLTVRRKKTALCALVMGLVAFQESQGQETEAAAIMNAARRGDPETIALVENLAETTGLPQRQLANSAVALLNAGMTSTQVRLALLEQGAAARAQAIAEAEKEFLGFKWGVGIGAVFNIGGSDRVDTANVVDGYVRIAKEANHTARIFSEVHNFRKKKDDPLKGHGPFVAIQTSGEQLIDSFSAGYMRGWRKAADSADSLNVGFGLVLDTKVKELGNGIVQDLPLPPGEDPTNVRLKERSRVGLGVFVSFSW
jgi:hypothetical protein